MHSTRSIMLASVYGMALTSIMFAAPTKASAGAAPVAPKPVAPKPAEVKAANVVETGQPIPAAAQPVPLAPPATAEAAKLTSSRAFEIEDDIPLPEKRIGVKGESIYPFDKIGPNQSFFVAATATIKEPWKTLTSMASRMSRDLYPKKFITARQTKDGVEGVRIWRASDATEPLAPPRPKKSKPVATEAVPEAGQQPNADDANDNSDQAAAE